MQQQQQQQEQQLDEAEQQESFFLLPLHAARQRRSPEHLVRSPGPLENPTTPNGGSASGSRRSRCCAGGSVAAAQAGRLALTPSSACISGPWGPKQLRSTSASSCGQTSADPYKFCTCHKRCRTRRPGRTNGRG